MLEGGGGRILAVDWGDRRIGLAISDPLGMIASPAGFLTRRARKRPPIAKLIDRAKELEAKGFVLGLPLDQNGNDTARATEVRTVAAELERRTGMTVELVAERYTTAAARRAVHTLGGRPATAGDVVRACRDSVVTHVLGRCAIDIEQR